MALKRHVRDRHGNVVAEEGVTLCICGCKYWEDDKCIDCGMTPERLWIIEHATALRLMGRLSLNVSATTMVRYDYPTLTDYSVSDYLYPENVTKEIEKMHVSGVRWAKPTDCQECGGSEDKHYLSCSIWSHNNRSK